MDTFDTLPEYIKYDPETDQFLLRKSAPNKLGVDLFLDIGVSTILPRGTILVCELKASYASLMFQTLEEINPLGTPHNTLVGYIPGSLLEVKGSIISGVIWVPPLRFGQCRLAKLNEFSMYKRAKTV